MKKSTPTQQEIETFRAAFRTLTLATAGASGEPEASTAPYVPDADGNLYVFVSALAQHTRNLRETGRAGVLFVEPEDQTPNVFARRRLSYRCLAQVVPRDTPDWNTQLDAFQSRFGPFIETLRDLGDFRLVRLIPTHGSYVAGFAQAWQLGGPRLRDIVHVDPTRVTEKSSARFATPTEVLDFWFAARARPMWFASTPEFDAEVCATFEETYRASKQNALAAWEQNSDGACALIILWDQLPHHMYRRLAESFAMESRARDVARHVIELGWDHDLTPERRNFVYLPFMHSEERADQEQSLKLFAQPGLEAGYKWARHHHDIIHRFNRFPHRNAILGRVNTPEEIAYLESEGAYRG